MTIGAVAAWSGRWCTVEFADSGKVTGWLTIKVFDQFLLTDNHVVVKTFVSADAVSITKADRRPLTATELNSRFIIESEDALLVHREKRVRLYWRNEGFSEGLLTDSSIGTVLQTDNSNTVTVDWRQVDELEYIT